jgi:GNAT superfamily N-acetyltransferase
MIVREAAPADLPAYFEHALRHFRESGNDGDLLFHPIVDFETWKKEEEIAKAAEGLALPLDRVGWLRLWVAEHEGRVVADALLRSGFLPTTGHRCQFAIGIERPHRGQGLGRRLSMQAISWARMQPSLAWMDLWVFAHNRPAIALYEKLGFRALDTVADQFRLGGERIDDTHMTMPLKP